MTTAAEERNGASDVTRARENPPSRKPAEHYWGGGHPKGKLFMLLLPWGRVRRRRRTSLPRSRGPVTHIRLSGASVFRRRAPVEIPLPGSRRPNRNPWFAESGAEW